MSDQLVGTANVQLVGFGSDGGNVDAGDQIVMHAHDKRADEFAQLVARGFIGVYFSADGEVAAEVVVGEGSHPVVPLDERSSENSGGILGKVFAVLGASTKDSKGSA